MRVCLLRAYLRVSEKVQPEIGKLNAPLRPTNPEYTQQKRVNERRNTKIKRKHRTFEITRRGKFICANAIGSHFGNVETTIHSMRRLCSRFFRTHHSFFFVCVCFWWGVSKESGDVFAARLHGTVNNKLPQQQQRQPQQQQPHTYTPTHKHTNNKCMSATGITAIVRSFGAWKYTTSADAERRQNKMFTYPRFYYWITTHTHAHTSNLPNVCIYAPPQTTSTNEMKYRCE